MLNRSQEIGQERMPKGGFGGLTLRAIIMGVGTFSDVIKVVMTCKHA